MKYLQLLLTLIFSTSLFSQDNKLKAYLDCRCDENFIKQETSFIEYVRDQDLADIVILLEMLEHQQVLDLLKLKLMEIMILKKLYQPQLSMVIQLTHQVL